MQERLWQVRVEVDGRWVWSDTVVALTAEEAVKFVERTSQCAYEGQTKCLVEDFVDIDFIVSTN